MSDGALSIMESLRAGRIQPDHAVVLLMYEARWPVEAAERGVFGPRQDFQELAPAPKPCGCEDETASEAPPDPAGSLDDLIAALQQQADGLDQVVDELKAETATHEPALPAEGGPTQ